MNEEKWYNDIRMVHLGGGLRARNQGAEVFVTFGGDNHVLKTSINRYHDLPHILMSLGFTIIGIDYFETPEQIKSYYPPFWYAFNENLVNKDFPHNVEKQWSELANAAFNAKNIELMDVCSRIHFEIRACNLRLRQLSEAYNVELWSLNEMGQFSLGKVETLNSFSISLETHDLLRELCTLRDYLAEFIANFVLENLLAVDNRILSMTSLIKAIKSNKILDNDIGSELLGITNTNECGWLAKLSAYRDLVVHYVPLSQASGRGFVIKRFLPGNGLGDFPSIYFPIPSDPFGVKQLRSKGSPFKNISEWIEASKKDDAGSPDALEYCSHTIGKMMSLACKIAELAPILPEMPTFVDGVDGCKIKMS